MLKATLVIDELSQQKDQHRAQVSQRFFKTGPGEYGAGDIFWGLTVPAQRQIAQKYKDLPLTEVKKLIYSPVHEQRLTGLLILVYQYEQSNQENKTTIFEFYLEHRSQVNNWDLVDVTTPKIVGDYILKNSESKKKVFVLISSKNLWERRIALLATFPFIKAGKFTEIQTLTVKVLKDQHVLIHKASGWMLREMGKIDQPELISFLDQYATKMPRTMLRYAIEKLAEPIRKKYLAK
ncbi:MAG: DNA alkylation repair protein [Candidatus Pacebacteria bacterium]|nr:DNA alkylation repair protein [Candidatus Paceibacterota bacterium]